MPIQSLTFNKTNIYKLDYKTEIKRHLLYMDDKFILSMKESKDIGYWKEFLEMISVVATRSCWNEQLCLYSDNTAEVLKDGRVAIRDSQKHIRHRLMILRDPQEVVDGLNNLISMMKE